MASIMGEITWTVSNKMLLECKGTPTLYITTGVATGVVFRPPDIHPYVGLIGGGGTLNGTGRNILDEKDGDFNARKRRGG